LKPPPRRGRLILLSRFIFSLFMAACLVSGQGPLIGTIEIFGLSKVPKEKVRNALGAEEGKRLPRSKTDAEAQIEGIEGIVKANLEAVCCEEGKAVLYIGIEERGGPHFDFLTPPETEIRLPEEIEKEWIEFVASISLAARRGNLSEDLTQGHSLMADPDTRRIQEKFVDLAAKYHDVLVGVLRQAEDGQQRAMAAFVLGYSGKKKQAADELQRAIRDPDATVRSNALQSLNALIVLAERDKEQGIRVTATWFVEMLHSVYFTDRNRASIALVNLTEKRDAAMLAQLRDRALNSLIEMAAWRSLGHALPAFILLGRIAGLAEERIQELWKESKYEDLLKQVKQRGKRRP